MNKRKCLIISSSPRRYGNSEVLCQQFARGAQAQGVDVEIIHLNDYQIAPCIACEYCRHHDNQCFRQDDANQIIQKMIDADIWVLSTPVYFYSVSAQLKLLIDRLFAREYEIRESSKRKDAYFIITSGSPDHQQMVGTIESLRGFIRVLRTVDEKGIIYGTGAFQIGDAIKHPSYQESYEMGQQI